MCLRHLPKRVAVRKVAQIGLASIALRKMAFVAWIVVAFFGSLRRLHLHHDGGDVLPLQRLHDGLGAAWVVSMGGALSPKRQPYLIFGSSIIGSDLIFNSDCFSLRRRDNEFP